MKTTLSKQIKTYTGLVTAILFTDKVNAQIVYTDIVDTTISHGGWSLTPSQYYLNLNGDTIPDFILSAFGYSTGSGFTADINILPLKGNKANNGLYHAGWWNNYNAFGLNAMKLNPGDTINGNGNWLSNKKYLRHTFHGFSGSTSWSSAGGWDVGDDNYLPLQFSVGNNNYFGWVHIEIVHPLIFIVKDYAYNSIANATILAGDTLNAAAGIPATHSSLKVFNQHKVIKIISSTHLENASIKIYDLIGNEIHTQVFSGNELEIPVAKNGIYIVKVADKQVTRNFKLFIY